jgi:tetratricopeptide (TPR) repeat protein
MTYFALPRCFLCFTVLLLSRLFLASSAMSAQSVPAQDASAHPRSSQDKSADSEAAANEEKKHDASPPDYSKEASVVELLKTRYSLESDGTGQRVTTLRVRVQSESALQAWGQLRLGYNSANESLDIGYVRVIKEDGSVLKAGPDAVQDRNGPVQQFAPVYTDYREKHVSVPGLRPGDVLEFEITKRIHTPFAVGQFWMQHDFVQAGIVLDEEVEIDVPAARVVKVKNKPGMDPKIAEENGRRIYRWSSSHLETEDSSKDKKDDAAKRKKKKKADEIPDIQMTTFTDWAEVGSWYVALEKDRRKPTREIRAKADELTKGLTTDMDKTEALYDYVAKDFRYVSLSLGLARYQPQAANDVLRNQYGDCKDKNTLLAALLEAEGLHSSSVLINTTRKLDPDVPSPAQFNHAITMLPLGKEEVWMDTTTEVAPFRLLVYTIRKKQALVIPFEGRAHLEETPADPPMPDTEIEEIQGKVDESGRLEATLTETLRGDAEFRQRAIFRMTPRANWQTVVEGMNKALGGEVSDVKVSDPGATREPFVFSYKVSKGNFIDWTKKKIELKLPLSWISPKGIAADVGEEDDSDPSASESEKPEPFEIGPPNEASYTLRLELAPRYSVTAPVTIGLQRDYAAYQSTYKLDGNIFAAERKLTVRQDELPPDRADDYRSFRRSVLADGAQALGIESAVADTNTVPADMKTADLIRSGNEARKNGNYSLATDLLKRAVQAEPKSRNAWNDLGLAYLESEQDDQAIAAFQKQIGVNPYDAFAYNSLGRVYLRERKYDEAEKWFRKQIEIDPLDKYAHANLGDLFMEQHRYADALPELQQAATISRDSAGSQVRLGEAYLNLDQDDKAMDAFDKAVKISASASVWNNIAYQLSLKGTHLGLARQYAESAISETAARLRNVSLDRLKQSDLNLTNALGTYWDTLGWIAFAEGNSEVARNYISAAWDLDDSGEVADHMGQICEKAKDKSGAAHWYALALSGRRPMLDTRGRLAALVGGDDKVDAIVSKYKGELMQVRTIKVKNTAKVEGRADFFLLFSRGAGSDATAADVKFVSGNDAIKGLGAALQSSNITQKVPDGTILNILRRGTLTCTRTADECTMTLARPDEVKSVD